MAINAKFISLATIFFSMIVGLLFYFWMSPFSKEEKKKQLEEVTNFFINFVFFMWVGKVIMNFPIFISDPLAVLAYPADSNSFYIAIVGSILRLIYKRKNMQLSIFLNALLPVILIASFMFEFIQFLLDGNLSSLMSMVIYMILVLIYYSLFERVLVFTLFSILAICWFIGTLMMYFTQPYVSFFGYLLSLPFILLFFLFNVGALMFIKIKR